LNHNGANGQNGGDRGDEEGTTPSGSVEEDGGSCHSHADLDAGNVILFIHRIVDGLQEDEIVVVADAQDDEGHQVDREGRVIEADQVGKAKPGDGGQGNGEGGHQSHKKCASRPHRRSWEGIECEQKQ